MSIFSALVLPFDSPNPSDAPRAAESSTVPAPCMRCIFRSLAVLRLSMQAERK